jgi:ABC-type transport system involved in Fe-S cluster assembly fused permease/ATPase subunit
MPFSPQQTRPPHSAKQDGDDWHIDQLDIAHYRALLKQQARADTAPTGMEIGGGGKTRSIKRLIAYALLILIVSAIFTVLFVQFTANLRVALVIVVAMLLYMLITAHMAEGRFDSRQ